MGASPTARSLQLLRSEGFTAGVVERWLPRVCRRVDLFGFLDLVAVRADPPAVVGVQTTTSGNLASRQAKALVLPELWTWLAAGCAFELHGWCKRRGRWCVRRVAVRLDDVPVPVVVSAPARRQRQRKGERQQELFELSSRDGQTHP